MELATRRILHVNVTAHPTALWACNSCRTHPNLTTPPLLDP